MSPSVGITIAEQDMKSIKDMYKSIKEINKK